MKELNIKYMQSNEYMQIKSLLVGVFIAYAITIIGFISYAIALTYGNSTGDNMNIIITVITVLSVLVAGFDTAKNAKSKGLLWGMFAGATYSLIMVLLGIVLVDNYSLDLQTVILISLSFLTGGVGGILGINIKKK